MIGIDTITIRVPIYLAPEFLIPTWNLNIYDANSENENWCWKYQSFWIENIDVRCKYFPQDYSRHSSLVISISSLARTLAPNNVNYFRDIDHAIENLDLLLRTDPNIPIIENLSFAKIVRLDIFCRYEVGDLIEEYLNLVSRSFYPHRTRCPYQNGKSRKSQTQANNGVVFRARLVETKFYDKFLQNGIPACKGFLRHEIEMVGSRLLSDFTGVKNPSLRDISETNINNQLSHDLEVLHLNTPVIDRNSRERELIKNFGNKKGNLLNDLVKYRLDHPDLSKKQIAENRGISLDEIQRSFTLINKCGISPISEYEGNYLAPLSEYRV